MSCEKYQYRFSPSVWGSSSVGRAPESHSGGRRFDPALLHNLGIYSGLKKDVTASRDVRLRPGVPFTVVVLDGELAVPCNPQPAIAGLNSHIEVRSCVVGVRVRSVESQVLRNERSPNPVRTGR